VSRSTAAGAGPDVVRRLRSAYRRCLLGLAARDLTGALVMEDVAAELADLAAAVLSAAGAVARADLRDPEPFPGRRPIWPYFAGLLEVDGSEKPALSAFERAAARINR